MFLELLCWLYSELSRNISTNIITVDKNHMIIIEWFCCVVCKGSCAFVIKQNNFQPVINNFFYLMISDRAPSEWSCWDTNDDELRGSFSTDGDGKH